MPPPASEVPDITDPVERLQADGASGRPAEAVPAPATTGTGAHRHAGSPGLAQRVLLLSLRPIGIFVASRLGTLMIAGAVAYAKQQPLSKSLIVWDSGWYLSIARSGYAHSVPATFGNPAQTNLGFFPLLPLLVRITHLVTGLSINRSGLVTTFAVGLVAAVAVWWLVRDVYGDSAADRGTALVFFSPGAFVLSLVYTEGATIALVAFALLALRHRRWLAAGLLAGVATAADPVATAAVVPCAIAAYQAIRLRGEWRALLAPLLAPLGIGTFFLYLWFYTGSPLEWFNAQRHGWQGGSYFWGVPGSLMTVVRDGVAYPNATVKTLSAVVAIPLVVLFLRARPPATWIGYSLTVLGFGILSPIIGITPRLILRGFPLLAVAGARLRRPWFEALLGLSALCLAALAVLAMGSPGFTP
ncbi:MAG: hypothetical protein M0Z62_11475 [Actinomycetota bacterium]|nr:hypothetical protein [Actinomycetota bacterium]